METTSGFQITKRLARIMIATVVATGLSSGIVSAQDAATPGRVSIAISGGASKGAYEAGLNWALLKLIRASAELASITGGRVRPSELASVAGASAGGVNSLLSGLTWCTRPESEGGIASSIDDNVFRDTWLGIDINSLLPPQADSESYLPGDALFSRKDYFLSANELIEKWRKPAFRKGCRVPMGVTVTRVEPLKLKVGDVQVQNQRFYIPFELRVQEDGSIAFFFDPGDYSRLNDPAMILMPRAVDAPEFSISDQRVIEAAATTSAFPVAFGRRLLKYCRLEVGATASSEENSVESDADKLICPNGYKLDEAEFADGGLFDNLPVGLARNLAELHSASSSNPLPVVYIYLDPGRTRYHIPELANLSACSSGNPPEACQEMKFNLFSESRLLLGALGTARKYELFRETTSDNWRLNLSNLAYQLAEITSRDHPDLDCGKELPYYDRALSCAEAITRAADLLDISYDRVKPEILSPYSVEALKAAGLVDNCQQSLMFSNAVDRLDCRLDIKRYRDQLAVALLAIIEHGGIKDEWLPLNIARARYSIHDDRVLRVSSRGSPITGTLLEDFGSFLDFKFREYDYYVGIYDAIVVSSQHFCKLQYPPERQAVDYDYCVNSLGRLFYHAIGIADNTRANYLFARIAEREFTDSSIFKFTYSPLPAVDQDMQIIDDGLQAALEAGEGISQSDQTLFATETTFFEYLKLNNFVPTETEDGAEPLLTQIIANPLSWSTEVTRRGTARLVYLERQATEINKKREPNKDLRDPTYTALLGLTAHTLQSMTFEYPKSSFAPSTAPESWKLRYLIPYEASFDVVEGDFLMTWQPTLALSNKTLLNLRASLGFQSGLLRTNSVRENYFALGVGYVRRTGSPTISSYGIVPTLYHRWDQPTVGDQDTAGGDVFMGFFKDRLRVGLGARDLSNTHETWFLTVGITDLPGLTYWLTR